ncbi:MAG: hypothetical protein WBE58_02485 [Verrucomicrobiales bacterium]|nr:hypothetical protein [Verrucomicrobiales bacterium]
MNQKPATPAKMKQYWPWILAAGGVLLMGYSFLHGILFVGLPGPDDSVAEMNRQGVQAGLAFVVFLVGSLCCLTGVVSGILRWALRRSRQANTV